MTAARIAAAVVSAALVALPSAVAAQSPAAERSPTVVLRAPQDKGAAPRITRVLLISVDGLNPNAIKDLGRAGAPTLHRLLDQGASTLNARTEYESTQTLPNHTGMVTSRRVDAPGGGHGVWWNDHRLDPATVQLAAGHGVASVFSRVKRSGGSTASFVSKRKLLLFGRSWAIDHEVLKSDNAELVAAARQDLRKNVRRFTFVHLSLPDSVGHAEGYMEEAYLEAVATTDARIGLILKTITSRPRLRKHTAVIVTSDHGGRGTSHGDETAYINYRVPFFVWGPGVARGEGLYSLNADYRNPARKRPKYAVAKPPIRNGEAGNLALDLLGLKPIPRSEMNLAQGLDVLAP